MSIAGHDKAAMAGRMARAAPTPPPAPPRTKEEMIIMIIIILVSSSSSTFPSSSSLSTRTMSTPVVKYYRAHSEFMTLLGDPRDMVTSRPARGRPLPRHFADDVRA